jgi:hypothetical protein
MLFSAAKILIVAYVATCILVFLFQRSILFARGGDMSRDPSEFGWAFEDVWLSHDMGKSHAWHIHTESPTGTVLFSHGNAGDMSDRLESIEDFLWLGFDVLIYDYGGYGNSDGSPSEARCYADIRAAWNFLVDDQGVAPSDIVLFGRSLGTGSTSWLATQVKPAAVILESPFFSVPKIAQEQFPFLPAKWLTRDRFDSGGRVALIEAPLLIIHSRDDQLIPFHHGEQLFAAASEPKEFLEIHGGHNDGWFVSRNRYRPALSEFLESATDSHK